jgi:hypothetical protein
VARRPKSWSLGYPPDVRQRTAAYVTARRAAGVRPDAIATELGISRHSVLAWSQAPEEARHLALVPVVMAAEPPTLSGADSRPAPAGLPAPVLVSPRGFRVEGLDVATLGALLERLG